MENQTAEDLVRRLKAARPDEFAVLKRALSADTRLTVQRALATAQKRIDAILQEQERLAALYAFDAGFDGIVVGLDEVGRGPLAGPLTVGAVVLDSRDVIEGLNDSKQLKAEPRARIAQEIQNRALAWDVFSVEPSGIDARGMVQSLRDAFKGALSLIEAAGIVPDVVLIDGNPLHIDTREVNVVKGDSRSASIAAASIVAKVHRDNLMVKLGEKYPAYDFARNKGYASSAHANAIRAHGLSPVHRRSFCSEFLQDSLF